MKMLIVIILHFAAGTILSFEITPQYQFAYREGVIHSISSL